MSSHLVNCNIHFSRYNRDLVEIAVGLNGIEPSTSRLSGVRSNRLSYKPVTTGLVSESGPIG